MFELVQRMNMKKKPAMIEIIIDSSIQHAQAVFTSTVNFAFTNKCLLIGITYSD